MRVVYRHIPFACIYWDFYNVRIDLAPWRVLGIDKCGSLRAPQPRNRHEKYKKKNTENQNESAAWGSAAAFSAAQCFLSLALFPFHVPLEFAFSVGYGSIVPRGRQRPQNRRLKHLYKRIESRVRIVSLLGSFAVYEAFPDLYATILPLSR